MGNLLTNTQGIIIPKTKYTVIIRRSHYASDQSATAIQQKVDTNLNAWRQAGFEIEVINHDDRDQVNEELRRRSTEQLHNLHQKQSITAFQQDGCYFDFNEKSSPDKAFQSVLPQDDFASSSDVIKLVHKRHILKSDIVHEFGHVLGLAHEHQRVDRKEHAVPQDGYDYFNRIIDHQPVQTSQRFVPFGQYDSVSVMHYPGIFKLFDDNNKSNIGGSISSPNIRNMPSSGDLMTARFLFNEARIREKLYEIKQTLKSKATPTAHNKFGFLNEINNSVAGQNLSQVAQQTDDYKHQRMRQKNRLSALMKNKSADFSTIMINTYDAIKDQLTQLDSLNLAVNHNLDVALNNFAIPIGNSLEAKRLY